MPISPRRVRDGKIVRAKKHKDEANAGMSSRGNRKRRERAKHIETVKEQQRLGLESAAKRKIR